MKNSSLTTHPALAASITKAASRQTYYTIRYLVDRERMADAYRAYAYMRWVDDTLDGPGRSLTENQAFVARQQALLERCYQGQLDEAGCPEEHLLVQLVRTDTEPESGLQAYLRNLMAVMVFDTRRRGQLITQAELDGYSHSLASAVTEAMHHFIGHTCSSPHDRTRYLAVTAAHISHMLRDTWDDLHAGYFNIPAEVLRANRITPEDVHSEPYRLWVQKRVRQARAYFRLGKTYLNRVGSLRCRFAGMAYAARFEWLLDTVEREDYYLRPQYDERKSIWGGLQMGWLMGLSLLKARRLKTQPQPAIAHSPSQEHYEI